MFQGLPYFISHRGRKRCSFAGCQEFEVYISNTSNDLRQKEQYVVGGLHELLLNHCYDLLLPKL